MPVLVKLGGLTLGRVAVGSANFGSINTANDIFVPPAPQPSGEWILQTGEWNDGGVWIDSATWNDGTTPTWILATGFWNDEGVWVDSSTWID